MEYNCRTGKFIRVGFTMDFRETADNTARSEVGPMIALPEAVAPGTVSIVDNGELAYRIVFADNGSGAVETVQLFAATDRVPPASANDVRIKKTSAGAVYNAGANTVRINSAAALPPCGTVICLQDETNPGNSVTVNTTTGGYIFFCNGVVFFCNGVVIASGTSTLNVKGCIGSVEDQKGDRRVYIEWDGTAVGGKGAGTAILQLGPNNTKCQITDKDESNNTCGGAG